MDTSYPLVTIIYQNSTAPDFTVQEITKIFYENNPDKFDFISIYPATSNFSRVSTSYAQAQSFIKGIGGTSYYDDSITFGSNHKLLGSAYYRDYLENMNSVSAYSSALKLLHETGHQWCCFAGSSLGILDQHNIHFYNGLDSQYENGAAMGSYPWISNGDGTYRTTIKELQEGEQPNKYHPFALYFMGFYNSSNFDFNKKFGVYDANSVNRATLLKEISIQDIINVEGERECDDSSP